MNLAAAKPLSLAAAKPLSPNELTQSYTGATDDEDSHLGKGHSPQPSMDSAYGDDDDDGDKRKDDHIKVICRFRPKNGKERGEEKRQNLDDGLEISMLDDMSLNVPRKSRNKKEPMVFTVDRVIWHDNSQEDTFNKLARTTVDAVIEGYNCTIFAFGQTGSGKTYTMFGPDNLARVHELGVIPRSVDYMFKLLNESKNILKYQISLSIVEVYKEMLRDLLTTDKKNRKRLEILSARKDVTVKNLTERACESVADILKYIVMAQGNRAKHTTDFIGHDSSRSHCVVMISVTQRLADDSIKFSKLNFGDLAGSELAAKTGTSGTNLKEAGKIHQGLLALENVINALVEKKGHIPYNDSKLTRLLSTSIGGNSKTTLLVTCSPSIWNRDETISTLRFARRAKKIKNKAKINKRRTREQLEARVKQLEEENATLKKTLSSKKYGGPSVKKNKSTPNLQTKEEQIFGMTAEEKQQTDEMLQAKDDELKLKEDELAQLKELLDKKDDQMKQLEEDLEVKQEIVDEFDKEKKQYQQQINKLATEVTDSQQQIDKLQTKLETNMELETKIHSHTQNLSSIVNDSVKDSNEAMVNALTEITKQQAEFYNFLKELSVSIEKIHDKQVSSEREINNRFDDVNQALLGIGGGRGGGGYLATKQQFSRPAHSPSASYDPNGKDDDEVSMISTSEYDPITPRHYDGQESINFDESAFALDRDRNLSVGSLMISPEQLAIDSRDKKYSMSVVSKDEADTLTDLISSMQSYLDKARDLDAQKADSKEDKKQTKQVSAEEAKHLQGDFSVGKRVDVMDVSYVWYTATIIDIDVFDKLAVFVKYDNFEERWNEWIMLSHQYRIAPFGSRTGIGESIPALKNEHGGCHALVTTKYGKSQMAVELQEAFASERTKDVLPKKAIFLQGHLYKRSNWSKKSWKRRWFVIRNNWTLYYYDHKNMKSKQYRGVIALGAISVVRISKEKGYTQWSFHIRTHNNKTHYFSCANEQDLVDWITVLECLIWGDCDQININKPGQQTIGGSNNLVDADDDDEKEEEDKSSKQKQPEKDPEEEGRGMKMRRSITSLFDSLTTKKETHQGPYKATVQQID